MRRFIDVVRALIASGERTFWLAAMAVQPLLTQLLKRKYTASGTDAELERFFERHFVSGDRGESDWLAREISDQEIHDSITPATPDFLVLMLSCMVGQVDTPKLFKVNPKRYRESLAMGSVMIYMRSLIRRSARSLGKTQLEFEAIEVQHRQWGGHRDGGGKAVESAADLEPRDAVLGDAPLVSTLRELLNRKFAALRFDPDIAAKRPFVSGSAAMQADVIEVLTAYAKLRNFEIDWTSPTRIVESMPVRMLDVVLVLIISVTQGFRAGIAPALKWRHLNLRVYAHGAVSVTFDHPASSVKFGTATADDSIRHDALYSSLDGSSPTFAKYAAGTQRVNAMAEEGVQMVMSVVDVLIALLVATGRLDAGWKTDAIERLQARQAGEPGLNFADYIVVGIRGDDDYVVPMAASCGDCTAEQWAAMPGGDSQWTGPTRDLQDDDAREATAGRLCAELFAAVGWFCFSLRQLRCGWLVEEFIHAVTTGEGILPASFFERIRIHHRWANVNAMEPYIRAAINIRFYADGRVRGVDRQSFVHGHVKRVVLYNEQYARDASTGERARKFGWGWVTYADIHDGDANERWHLDNAIYDVRSPYFRDDRDDALFFNACESLFLPREYAALRAKYSALDVDAARALARNPEGRALIAASKLAARKQLDRATRDDAAKGWKTRFVKEQVGFGNTWRQQ